MRPYTLPCNWLDDVRPVDVPAVAPELGMQACRRSSWAPCPVCGAWQRSESEPDGRGPVGLTPSGFGWSCHRCKEKGDALDLVALFVVEKRLRAAGGDGMRAVQAWYADRGWCAAPGTGVETVRRSPLCAPVQPRVEERRRPPAAEVEAFWSACLPVDRTGSARGIEGWPAFFLSDRRFCTITLAGLDVVRVAPLRCRWPSWWPARWAQHYRLVVRAFEPDGTFASVHARAVPAYGPDGVPLREVKPKTRWPFGFAAGRLLFADGGGLALLRGEPRPDLAAVWVVEGLTDLLRASLEAARDGGAKAVLGATSGGFEALAHVRWPRGIQVFAATDPDRTGDRYALTIAEAVKPLPVYRYNLKEHCHA